MRRILLLVLFLPVLLQGQTVRLTFAEEASRRIWTADSPSDPPNTADSITNKTFEFTANKKFVCVLDEATGNLAVRESKEMAWSPTEADFKLIGRVDATADPAPKTASFSCQGQTRLVTPENAKPVSFYGLKPGLVEVELTYADGGDGATRKQAFELKLSRSDAVPRLIIGLPSTATPSATPPAKPAATQAEGKSLLGTIVAVLLVAALAIGVLVLGMKWIYANQEDAHSALAKLGVKVPDPLDPDPDPGTPPDNPIAGPVIMAPIVLPGDGPAVVVGPSSLSVPKLVGTQGSFELGEGVHIVGREAGLTIALTGESSISRRHAEIVRSGGEIVLRDLGSTNGTFVNGNPIDGDVTLRIGDTVRFGAVQMRVES